MDEKRIKILIQRRNSDGRLRVFFGGGRWLWGTRTIQSRIHLLLCPPTGHLGEYPVVSSTMAGAGAHTSLCLKTAVRESGIPPGLFHQPVSCLWWYVVFSILNTLSKQLCLLEISQIRHLLLIPCPVYSEIVHFYLFSYLF